MNGGLVVTADGEVFRGRSVGYPGVSTGEVVFNTSMTGYQEVLTDPSYAGQVVVMTMPHIGNYGVTPRDDQAAQPAAAGLIVRSLSRRHSNWRAEGSLPEYLHANRIVTVADLDTRRLTRHIREAGAMPVAIGSGADEGQLRELAAAAPTMEGQNLAGTVSTARQWRLAALGEPRGHVVALDLGMKRSIAEELAGQGYDVTVVPMDTSASEILESDPDGVFLSNGPGDPEPLTGPISAVQELLGRVPVFGICLGHQVLCLALGARTYKLPFGHHGANHPVQRLGDRRVEVTSHNHGFAVDLSALGVPGDALDGFSTKFGAVDPTHVSLNDGTLEGIACREVPAFSVQYHPEAAPGPHDARSYFRRFADSMEAAR